MLILKIVLFLALCLVGASFVVANGEAMVPVNYLSGELELPLVVLMLAALAFGVVVGMLLLTGPYAAARLRANKLDRKQAKMERELHALRQVRSAN